MAQTAASGTRVRRHEEGPACGFRFVVASPSLSLPFCSLHFGPFALIKKPLAGDANLRSVSVFLIPTRSFFFPNIGLFRGYEIRSWRGWLYQENGISHTHNMAFVFFPSSSISFLTIFPSVVKYTGRIHCTVLYTLNS